MSFEGEAARCERKLNDGVAASEKSLPALDVPRIPGLSQIVAA
jgi:hypothetical protein